MPHCKVKTNSVIIISGGNSYRFQADINHKNYAVRQSIDYEFYLNKNLENPYFTKCYAILDSFNKGYDYVIWIDDDAFFINYDWECCFIFKENKHDIIVTQDREKKGKDSNLFNNGIMFLRNTNKTKELFRLIPHITKKEMCKNWKPQWGSKSNQDQSRMIYLTQAKFDTSLKIVPYPGFNAHEFTFKQKDFLNTKPPIVHFAGNNKQEKINRFQNVTGIQLP